MQQPELTGLSIQEIMDKMEFDATQGYYRLPANKPADELALEFGPQNTNKNDMYKVWATQMLYRSFNDLYYPFYEGNSERFEHEHSVGDDIAPGHLDYELIEKGVEEMLTWTGGNYDFELYKLLDENNHEAHIGLSIMYRRELLKKAVNNLVNAQIILDMGDDEELVEAANSTVRPEELEFFQFNDVQEFHKYVKRFMDFEQHPDIQVIYQTFAELSIEAAQERFAAEGRALDEKHINIDYYRNVASNGMLFYTMLSRTFARSPFSQDPDIDFKGITLAKLGIEDEVVVDGNSRDAFPIFEVPDNVVLNKRFIKSKLLTQELAEDILYNMINHTANWNVWFK